MLNTNVRNKYYHIGHVYIQINANNESLLELIGDWMIDFEVPFHEGIHHAIVVTLIGYNTGQLLPFKIPKHAKLTFENDTAKYYLYRNLWIVDFSHIGIMIINRSSNKITGFVYHNYLTESLWHFEDFMHPLYELMRQKGLYPHHAAAVSHNGHGFLLLGKSGQGKTTLSIDLINNGFNFLCDDRCFVREQLNRIEMFGFYEPFKVFASNVTHIPTLRNAAELSLSIEIKNSLDIRHYYPEKIQLTSKVKGIIFPCWSPLEKSKLEIVSSGKALLELLPLTMVCFEAASSKAHFEFAGRLVNQIPSARLIMGNDRENWNRLVLDFISHSTEALKWNH